MFVYISVYMAYDNIPFQAEKCRILSCQKTQTRSPHFGTNAHKNQKNTIQNIIKSHARANMKNDAKRVGIIDLFNLFEKGQL